MTFAIRAPVENEPIYNSHHSAARYCLLPFPANEHRRISASSPLCQLVFSLVDFLEVLLKPLLQIMFPKLIRVTSCSRKDVGSFSLSFTS